MTGWLAWRLQRPRGTCARVVSPGPRGTGSGLVVAEAMAQCGVRTLGEEEDVPVDEDVRGA